MTEDNYQFRLLSNIEELLAQHNRAIAQMQDRLNKTDILFGNAITRLHERFDQHELWAKQVLDLLQKK